MFGYLTINKPELKIKEYSRYKAYYCGLCDSLKKEYGPIGQITLTYDMTFALVLLSSLYEVKTEYKEERCLYHPTKKHPVLKNEISDYVANMNIALTYHKLDDDWMDDHSIKGYVGKKAYKRIYQKTVKKYERQCTVIEQCLTKIHDCEKNQCTNIDEVSGLFGQIMGEIFAYKQDEWTDILRNIGFYLGKFIYICDAYEDIEEDIQKKRYNPLKELYQSDQFESTSKEMLTMMMAECSRYFEQLPLVDDVELLRNIIYAGVWSRYDAVNVKKMKNREEQENDDRSI